MRPFVSGVLLLTVACGGGTTGTAQEATDTTTVPSTLAPATTVVLTRTSGLATEECKGADRGFLCPPDLPRMELTGGQGDLPTSLLAPGTYRTRLFDPAFEFTRRDTFRSLGETHLIVSLDIGPGGTQIFDRSELPEDFDLQAIGGDECAQRASIAQEELLGREAVVLDIVGGQCDVRFPVPVVNFFVAAGFRARFYAVDLGEEGSVVVWVQAAETEFDRYFEQTARPTLDTVRFIDD